MSVEIRTPPSLGFWSSLVITIRGLDNSLSDSPPRSLVQPPQPSWQLQPPHCMHGPRSQEHSIFPYRENQREQEQAKRQAQHVFLLNLKL